MSGTNKKKDDTNIFGTSPLAGIVAGIIITLVLLVVAAILYKTKMSQLKNEEKAPGVAVIEDPMMQVGI